MNFQEIIIIWFYYKNPIFKKDGLSTKISTSKLTHNIHSVFASNEVRREFDSYESEEEITRIR
jgi:hypothetical protein